MEILRFGKFLEISKLDIFRIFQIEMSIISRILQFGKLTNSYFFQFGKWKFGSKNEQILFDHSILRTFRNFANPYIALWPKSIWRLNVSIFISYFGDS